MEYKTIIEALTYGDYMTLPGGIALRDRHDEQSGPRYIVQLFTTDRETGEARHYFRTNYASKLSEALEMFAEDVKRAESYDTGGSLNQTGQFANHNPAYGEVAA